MTLPPPELGELLELRAVLRALLRQLGARVSRQPNDPLPVRLLGLFSTALLHTCVCSWASRCCLSSLPQSPRAFLCSPPPDRRRGGAAGGAAGGARALGVPQS